MFLNMTLFNLFLLRRNYESAYSESRQESLLTFPSVWNVQVSLYICVLKKEKLDVPSMRKLSRFRFPARFEKIELEFLQWKIAPLFHLFNVLVTYSFNKYLSTSI